MFATRSGRGLVAVVVGTATSAGRRGADGDEQQDGDDHEHDDDDDERDPLPADADQPSGAAAAAAADAVAGPEVRLTLAHDAQQDAAASRRLAAVARRHRQRVDDALADRRLVDVGHQGDVA